MGDSLWIVEAGKEVHEWRPLAVLHFPEQRGDIARKQVIANADLFAASFDMLKALIGLEGILATAESNASGNPEWEAVSANVNAARAAIAKATGQ
ncbi:hypothetical protein ACWGM0_10740 [Sphingomonas bisphenolicum]